ncbi:uncharacterized protein (TIGR02246 family) [Amycolatopsis lexingtonensis]|uniref:Uncharacterized protein (TIGR02246 family) n=1 Tax=Amycolatopsis lexingtonensis TaxID=218822 RepID=A0ABR9HXA5_9PSEU|nr:nuclear transport factor 2 family protein [Amycolatopsis lexingtonensis]MBE1495570.1 uncharacterized protein (TIGR02246 family) [Amycolatopsis lexingtonensis]
MNHERMVREMCAAVDAGDAEAFASWFADDATYVFGNAEPLIGRAAITAATAGAAGALPWVRHVVDQVAVVGEDQLFCRFTIETESPAGQPLALPCVTVMWLEEERIVDYRVHLDLSPALTG